MTRQAEGEAVTARRCPIDLDAEADRADAEIMAEVDRVLRNDTAVRIERGLLLVAAAILMLGVAILLGGAS